MGRYRGALALAVCTGAASAAGIGLTRLGVRPGGTNNFIHPVHVSGDGRVVFGWGYGDDGRTHAFTWTDDGGLRFDDDPATFASYTYAFASSTDGSRIMARSPLGEVWMPGVGWSPIDPAGTFGSPFVCATSGDGRTAGGSVYMTDLRRDDAVLWRDGQAPIALPRLPGNVDGSARITAVSRDGLVVAGYTPNANGVHVSFRWTEQGGMEDLGEYFGSPLFPSPLANAINADGSVIVGRLNGSPSSHGYRWTRETGYVDLGFILSPNGSQTDALAVSADGKTIVGFTGSSQYAFIWTTERGMRDLTAVLAEQLGTDPFAGWTRMIASGVSDDGLHVAGRGRNPEGVNEVWVVRLPDPNGCVADVNGDGTLNLDDIILFAGAFTNAGLLADADRNGALDLNDVTAFADVFIAGCR
ncbi:MAG: GC-type dockerin domain-anchored protein [Phycisphaerales bacterium]